MAGHTPWREIKRKGQRKPTWNCSICGDQLGADVRFCDGGIADHDDTGDVCHSRVWQPAAPGTTQATADLLADRMHVYGDAHREDRAFWLSQARRALDLLRDLGLSEPNSLPEPRGRRAAEIIERLAAHLYDAAGENSAPSKRFADAHPEDRDFWLTQSLAALAFLGGLDRKLCADERDSVDCERCIRCVEQKRPAKAELFDLAPAFMILCPVCGNKRCPKATWHVNACTGSNEPGQPGSDYTLIAEGAYVQALDDHGIIHGEAADRIIRELRDGTPDTPERRATIARADAAYRALSLRQSMPRSLFMNREQQQEEAGEPIQGIIFILVRDGRVLMEKSAKKAARFGATHLLPGGRRESGESPEAALLREFGEELGARPVRYEALPLVDATGGDNPGAFLVRPFVVAEWEGEIPETCLDQPEIEFEWIPLEDAANSSVRQVRAMIAMLTPAQRAGV